MSFLTTSLTSEAPVSGDIVRSVSSYTACISSFGVESPSILSSINLEFFLKFLISTSTFLRNFSSIHFSGILRKILETFQGYLLGVCFRVVECLPSVNTKLFLVSKLSTEKKKMEEGNTMGTTLKFNDILYVEFIIIFFCLL